MDRLKLHQGQALVSPAPLRALGRPPKPPSSSTAVLPGDRHSRGGQCGGRKIQEPRVKKSTKPVIINLGSFPGIIKSVYLRPCSCHLLRTNIRSYNTVLIDSDSYKSKCRKRIPSQSASHHCRENISCVREKQEQEVDQSSPL